MARNGSGEYSAPTNSWNPAINGVLATAGDWQTLLNDIVSALTQSVSRDGQSPMTGNLQMGNNRITGLSAGSGTGQALSWEQLFSQGTEADIASAATTDIGAQNTNFLRVTGTTTITSFGTNYRGPRFLRFEGAVTLTNGTNLIIQGGANYTTAAGDVVIAVPKATLGTADGWYAIVPGAIANNSVTTSKIANNAVTPAKLANGGQELGSRNRIINGDMRIDQRNAGASISVSATGFPVDRFYINANSSGVISGQRSTVAPAGFTNSLLMTVTTPRGTIASNDVYGVRQTLEGFNTADFMWGSASAQTVTLSFWVRSSITGTYAVSLFNAAFNRSYVATYTVNAANTFEYKTIVVPGDATGTWATDNAASINVFWDVGSGSDFQATANTWLAAGDLRTSGSANWIQTNGATFYITGVQLEAGSVATPFERRPYGTELQLCQRYREAVPVHFGVDVSGVSTLRQNYKWVEKRAAPTATLTVQFWNGSSWNNPSSSSVNAGTGGGYISASGTSMRYLGHGTSQYQGLFESGVLILDSEL